MAKSSNPVSRYKSSSDIRAQTQEQMARVTATQKGQTRSARKQILQSAANGEKDAIEYLRVQASWFPESTAYQHRAPKPQASNAEIIAAAAEYLALNYPETRAAAPARPRSVSRPSLNPDAIYKSRAEATGDDTPELAEERRRWNEQHGERADTVMAKPGALPNAAAIYARRRATVERGSGVTRRQPTAAARQDRPTIGGVIERYYGGAR